MSKEKKEHVLTEKEKKRLEIFEAKAKELEEQGYTMKKLMISPFAANVGSLLTTLPFVILYTAIYFLVNGFSAMKIFNDSYNTLVRLLLVYVIWIALIVVHEGIHGFTWRLCTKDKSSISFGFNKAALAPYCTCSRPLTKSQYIIGALMPTLILGFLLGAVTIVSGNGLLFFVACLMFIGGGGDFLMVLNMLKTKVPSKDVLYYDHPTEIGSVVFYR